MDWTYVITFIAVVIAFFLVKMAGQISVSAARQHLRDGALVIDVRTATEFESRHLPKAINIPSSEIETYLPRRVTDKSRVLLLHCQSGMRSGVAKKTMRKLGYTNTFNLGSFNRAFKIVSSR
ncbi:MAG: rhodanese-like domain-containing protein [Terracidiphilus sp.]|jgi:phage shock protein E